MIGANQAQVGIVVARSCAEDDNGAVPVDQSVARLRQEIDRKN
jgi:hypothetical protein